MAGNRLWDCCGRGVAASGTPRDGGEDLLFRAYDIDVNRVRHLGSILMKNGASLQRLRLLERFLDRPHHVERLLGQLIAFAVDDVSEALKIVELHGVRIASPLQQRPDGFKQLYLYDPDGHLIELVSA